MFLSLKKYYDYGFTIIEILIVIVIILILSSLAIPLYEKYFIRNAMKASIVTDLRECISLIVVYISTKGVSPSRAINDCPKSKYTREIRLISEDPIILEAIGESDIGRLECSYNGNTGEISCDSPF